MKNHLIILGEHKDRVNGNLKYLHIIAKGTLVEEYDKSE